MTEPASPLAVRAGRLTVVEPDGKRHELIGGGAGPEATIRVRDGRVLRRLAMLPDPSLGEAWMDEAFAIEAGTLRDVIDFFAVNLLAQADLSGRGARADNVIGRAQENVAHHYDLNRELFALFLDDDLQYSCAYFPRPDATLEEAQAAKKARIAAKLLLEPGMRVLDIGSGWGGMALDLARTADVEVVGVTLSREQCDVANERAREAGLDDRVTFRLLDYREERGAYDRIVSVGMFEHVGRAHYGEFFDRLRDLMTDRGVALLHSIGRMAPPGMPVIWLNRYIFPGGYTPSLSETLAAIEDAGLWATDIEILRLHYAETLKAWNDRFQANRARAAALYDERFCRMWEFYLISCELAFRRLNWMVFQIQLAKDVATVPLTRDYLGA